MDAAGNVGSDLPPVPGEVLKKTEELRVEIEATSKLLHDHISELGDHLRDKIELRVRALANPFGLRDRFEQYPFSACVVALALGAALARSRQLRPSDAPDSGAAANSAAASSAAASSAAANNAAANNDSAGLGLGQIIKRQLIARMVEVLVRGIWRP
jgi:hypothetical protein